MIKVLVLTLYSGENEYPECKASVASQVGLAVEHKCFEWLPNKEAHETLYKEIMVSRFKFDYFVKLDADMVFQTERSLLQLVNLFSEYSFYDHISIPVFDIPSNSYLMGIHIFSNYVSWRFPLDSLFPDNNPISPGGSLIDYSIKLPVVSHMPNPSVDQSYKLGLHRASKIVQHNRSGKLKSAEFPISYLKRVFLNSNFDFEAKNAVVKGALTCFFYPVRADNYKISDQGVVESKFISLLIPCFRFKIFNIVFFMILRFRYVYFRRFFKII